MNSNITQRAYRRLIARLADLELDWGSPLDAAVLKAAGPLSADEIAAVCEMHKQAVTEELTLNPHVLAAFYRHQIGVVDLLAHLREVTESTVWEIIGKDAAEESQLRAIVGKAHDSHRRPESPESAHGVSGLFRS